MECVWSRTWLQAAESSFPVEFKDERPRTFSLKAVLWMVKSALQVGGTWPTALEFFCFTLITRLERNLESEVIKTFTL